ncbi:hypothetical protein ABZP36_002523 [Zizania latifolia]
MRRLPFSYVEKEIDVRVDKVLVHIDSTVLKCSHMRCLVKPATENTTYRWLDSEVINSYASIFKYSWEKDTKHLKYAVSAYHSEWLQSIGKDWIKTSAFSARVGPYTHTFCWNIVNSDMLRRNFRFLIPLNAVLITKKNRKNWTCRCKCSCEIFTIKYMKYWDGQKMTSHFSQDDMETFRKKMLAELIFSPLNEINFVKDDIIAMGDCAVANQRGCGKCW